MGKKNASKVLVSILVASMFFSSMPSPMVHAEEIHVSAQQKVIQSEITEKFDLESFKNLQSELQKNWQTPHEYSGEIDWTLGSTVRVCGLGEAKSAGLYSKSPTITEAATIDPNYNQSVSLESVYRKNKDDGKLLYLKEDELNKNALGISTEVFRDGVSSMSMVFGQGYWSSSYANVKFWREVSIYANDELLAVYSFLASTSKSNSKDAKMFTWPADDKETDTEKLKVYQNEPIEGPVSIKIVNTTNDNFIAGTDNNGVEINNSAEGVVVVDNISIIPTLKQNMHIVASDITYGDDYSISVKDSSEQVVPEDEVTYSYFKKSQNGEYELCENGLPVSTSGHVLVGEYKIAATVNSEELATVVFKVFPKLVTLDTASLKAEDKNADGTVSANVVGDINLSGVEGGDKIWLENIRYFFADAEPGIGKAVYISADMVGADSECYQLERVLNGITASITKVDTEIVVPESITLDFDGDSFRNRTSQNGIASFNSNIGDVIWYIDGAGSIDLNQGIYINGDKAQGAPYGDSLLLKSVKNPANENFIGLYSEKVPYGVSEISMIFHQGKWASMSSRVRTVQIWANDTLLDTFSWVPSGKKNNEVDIHCFTWKAEPGEEIKGDVVIKVVNCSQTDTNYDAILVDNISWIPAGLEEVISGLYVTQKNSIYGEGLATPVVKMDGLLVEQGVVYTYCREGDTDFVSMDQLKKSSSGNILAGTYQIKAQYNGQESVSSFVVEQKPLGFEKGSLTAENRVYDGTISVNFSGQPDINGVIQGDEVMVECSKMKVELLNSDVNADASLTLDGVNLVGNDAENYCNEKQAIDGLTVKISKAPGDKEPCCPEVDGTTILTNIVSKLSDIVMPEGWSLYYYNWDFVMPEDGSTIYEAQADYQPKDTNNYYSVTKTAKLSVTSIDVDFKNDFKSMSVGESKEFNDIDIKIIGAPLLEGSLYSTTNMEWFSSDENVATVSGDTVSSVKITAKADGSCMVGLRYRDTKKVVADTLISVGEQKLDTAEKVITMFKNMNSASTDAANIKIASQAYLDLSNDEKDKISYDDYRMMDSVYSRTKNIEVEGPEDVKCSFTGLAFAAGENVTNVKVIITSEKTENDDVDLKFSIKVFFDEKEVTGCFAEPVKAEIKTSFDSSNARVVTTIGGVAGHPSISVRDNTIISPIEPGQDTSILTIKSTTEPDQVGDYGYKINWELIEKNKDAYPQMEKWATAGKIGGIMDISDLMRDPNIITLSPNSDGSDSKQMNDAIMELFSKNGGVLYLKNGTYDIDEPVDIKTNVVVIGESRDGVVCIINKDITPHGVTGAFQFTTNDGAQKRSVPTKNAGITRLTIIGGFLSEKTGLNQPYTDWNTNVEADTQDLHYDSTTNQPKPDSLNNAECHENISVWFGYTASNCYADELNIYNAADFPIRAEKGCDDNTWRNLNVKGCFIKSGGCHGYFFMMGAHSLITGCEVTNIRHISLQGDASEYNVLFNNYFRQEISYHTGDNGNNLIEGNMIYLPTDMPTGYVAVMGPWSMQHEPSLNPNFMINNDIREYNHLNDGKPTSRWVEENTVYAGPYFVKPSDLNANFVKAGEALSITYYDSELAKEVSIKNKVIVPEGSNPSPIGNKLYAAVAPLKDWSYIVEPEAITISQTELIAEQNKNYQLSAVVTPQNATDASVRWMSSNEGVVKVDRNGKVEVIGGGEAVIKAVTYNGLISECNVKVVNQSIEGMEGPFTETFDRHNSSLNGHNTYMGDFDIEWTTPLNSSHHDYAPFNANAGIRIISEKYINEKIPESGDKDVYLGAILPTGLSEVSMPCHQTKWGTGTERAIVLMANGVVLKTVRNTGSVKTDSADDIFIVSWKASELKVTDIKTQSELKEKGFTFGEDGTCIGITGKVDFRIRNVSELVNGGNMNIAIQDVTWSPFINSTEEPSTEKPSTEEPSTENPNTEEPSTEKPSTEEPSTEEPSTENPNTEEPSTEETTTQEAVVAGNVTIISGSGSQNIKLEMEIKELIDKIFKATEKEQICNGKDANVIVNVKEISEYDNTAVADKIKAVVNSNTQIAQYYDIALSKQLGNGEIEIITSTNGKIRVSLEVPNEYILRDNASYSRIYSMIRVHGDDIDVLPVNYSKENNTVEFMTDKFSTYVLVYEDISNVGHETVTTEATTMEATAEATTSGETHIATESNSRNEEVSSEVETGDSSHSLIYEMMLLLSAMSLIGICVYTRKNKKGTRR